MTQSTPTDTNSAFDFYHSIRDRLPALSPDFKKRQLQSAPDLLSIADNFDVFVFDAFGVLNIGSTAIPGAIDCIRQLRARGKSVFVLTNGASAPLAAVEQKFIGLGFDFSLNEIVSSRHAAERAVARLQASKPSIELWGAITGGKSSADDLEVNAIELGDAAADYDRIDAFLFLSALEWDGVRQQRLYDSLQKRPRPLVVANPDVVAPNEHGFSLEPGYFTHLLMNDLPFDVEFHGKPFPSVYDLVRERIGADVLPSRIAMLGDTLHTDILGGATQGWTSVLVSEHGLFSGHDVGVFIEQSGIVPDWIVPSI